MLKKTKIKLLALCVPIIPVLFFAFRTDIKIAETTIKSNKVTEKLKFALITDLHSCDYGENQIDLLSKIYNQNPDVVLLSGDIVDDVLPQDNAIEFLSQVSKKYPTFYVSGNHEFWSDDIDEIKKMISDFGITVLEGDCIPTKIKNQTINICGVDDTEVGKTEFQNQLANCYNQLNSDNYSILLTHRPELIGLYPDFDLILAGHAHGGQWRIPFLLNGLLAPNQGLFPKYAGGLYEFENKLMIVSRGLAKESTFVPRIFNRPEIVIVNIIPE